MSQTTRQEHSQMVIKRAAAVLFSIGLHAVLLAGFASYVILPEIQELPSLILSPALPDDWIMERTDTEGGVSGSAVLPEQEVDRLLSQTPLDRSSILALPSPTTPMLNAPIDVQTIPLVASERMENMFASVSSLHPSRPRRAAFEGTVYFFDRARRVRSGRKWFKGKGKEESSHKLYAYAMWVPGRADKRVQSNVPVSKKWVGVDYQAHIWWPNRLAGICSFRLTSDAAAILQIDGKDVIDHDGSHGFRPKEKTLTLEAGPHHFRLAYLQGPRSKLGLLLHYQHPHTGGWRLLDIRNVLRENVTALAHPLHHE